MALGKRHVYSIELREGNPAGPKIYVYYKPVTGSQRRVGRKLRPYFDELGLSLERNLNDRNCMRVVEAIRAELEDRAALPAEAHDTPIFQHIDQHCDALDAHQRSLPYVYTVRRRLWAALGRYYKRTWKRRITPPLPWCSVADINKAELSRYLSARVNIDNVGPHDVNHDLRAWRGFGSWLTEVDVLPRNPLARMREFKVPDEPPKVLTPEQLDALRDAAAWPGGSPEEFHAAFPNAIVEPTAARSGEWYRHAAPAWLAPTLTLLMYTGMRPVEVSRLVWEHVDLDARTIIVKRKRGTHWVIPLASELVEFLTATRKKDRTGKVVSGFPYNEARKAPGNYWGPVRTAAARAGLPGVTLYWLRHSVATHLATRVSPAELQLMMGHLSYKTTNRYVRLVAKQIAHVPDKLPWTSRPLQQGDG